MICPHLPVAPGLASSLGAMPRTWRWIDGKQAPVRMAPSQGRQSRGPPGDFFAIPVVLGLVVGARGRVDGGGGSAARPDRCSSAARRHREPGRRRRGGHPAATGGAPIITDAANVNCDIIVPANPLTAQGLATPYLLTGPGGMTPAQSGCEMTNATALGAFVQATILDPATGRLSVYNPLVITKGTTPAVTALGAEPPGRRDRHDRLRVQRHRPLPGRRHAERAQARPTA